jgi:hypothetical protein
MLSAFAVDTARAGCGRPRTRQHSICPIARSPQHWRRMPFASIGGSRTRRITRAMSPCAKTPPASEKTRASSPDSAASPTIFCAPISPIPSPRTATPPPSAASNHSSPCASSK